MTTYEHVGNDGLTEREREAAACRWQETVARRPTVAELQELHQRLAEHAGEPMCRRCGHAARAHERYRPSDHCAWCGPELCKGFQWSSDGLLSLSWWQRVGVVICVLGFLAVAWTLIILGVSAVVAWSR